MTGVQTCALPIWSAQTIFANGDVLSIEFSTSRALSTTFAFNFWQVAGLIFLDPIHDFDNQWISLDVLFRFFTLIVCYFVDAVSVGINSPRWLIPYVLIEVATWIA